MRLFVNQLFVYALLAAALVALVFLLAVSPSAVYGLDDRSWLMATALCWAIVGYCLGVDTMRFNGRHAYAD